MLCRTWPGLAVLLLLCCLVQLEKHETWSIFQGVFLIPSLPVSFLGLDSVFEETPNSALCIHSAGKRHGCKAYIENSWVSASRLLPFRHLIKPPVLIQMWSAPLNCSDLCEDTLGILWSWKAASMGIENGNMFVIKCFQCNQNLKSYYMHLVQNFVCL